MATDNTTSKLATPRRTMPMQALSGLFRTPTGRRTPSVVTHRNKRARSRTSSLSSPAPSTPLIPPPPAVVLQTYSVSTDSIVLTSLPSVPFCCHEDLLTMSRPQLTAVVHALNARLPRRMRIGPEDDFWLKGDQDDIQDDDDDGLSRMSKAEMRRCIEELVGIRPVVGKNRVSRRGLGLDSHTGVPPAPKAMRTRDATWRPYAKTPWEMDVDTTEDCADGSSIPIEDECTGSSPLASRTASGLHLRARRAVLPRLAILREENEGGEPKEGALEDNEARPFKRQRRFSSDSLDPKGERQVVGDSRLIEHMDLSGSPLLAGDDDTFSKNDLDPDFSEGMATTVNCEKTPEEQIQPPLQRRRSARIKEITLKRASSVHARQTTNSHAMDLKLNILRSKTFSTRRSSTSTSFASTDVAKRTPRELTIRLPFTSTPPDQTPDPSSWSAPRVLRSHSQRLMNSTKAGSLLGRSKSERYPRASDLAFVTVNRPRYRFSNRKSNGSKGDRVGPSMVVSTEHGESQDEQCVKMAAEEPSSGKHEVEDESENHELKVAAAFGRSSVPESLHTFSSVLGTFLASRSRAPSASTDASILGEHGDSPGHTLVRGDAAPTVDGATTGVWEALGRMAVDSVSDG